MRGLRRNPSRMTSSKFYIYAVISFVLIGCLFIFFRSSSAPLPPPTQKTLQENVDVNKLQSAEFQPQTPEVDKGFDSNQFYMNKVLLMHPDRATATAPNQFVVQVTIRNKGKLRIQVNREWAPLGADRFYNLVSLGYYTQAPIFRSISGFMAQFGIADDPAISLAWRGAKIVDDPSHGISNQRGYLTFAHAGPNSRTTQLFINFGDNSRLDRQRFIPIGKVFDEDMDILDKIHITGEGSPNGPGPNQVALYLEGGKLIKTTFPDIDIISGIILI